MVGNVVLALNLLREFYEAWEENNAACTAFMAEADLEDASTWDSDKSRAWTMACVRFDRAAQALRKFYRETTNEIQTENSG